MADPVARSSVRFAPPELLDELIHSLTRDSPPLGDFTRCHASVDACSDHPQSETVPGAVHLLEGLLDLLAIPTYARRLHYMHDRLATAEPVDRRSELILNAFEHFTSASVGIDELLYRLDDLLGSLVHWPDPTADRLGWIRVACGPRSRSPAHSDTLNKVMPADAARRNHASSDAVEDAHVAPVPRVRRSRKELRAIVLEAGRDVLLTEGLGTGAEHLSFKRVLSHVAATRGIRITNASVIGRIWGNQEEFQLDVVNSVANIQGDEEAAVTIEALEAVLARLDVSTPELRRASLAELIRVTCAEYMAAASTSAATIQMALVSYVAASQSASADNRLIESFRSTNRRLTTRYEELYTQGLQACGWRIRPQYSMYEVAALLSAVAEGILLHQLVEPRAFQPLILTSGLDGTEVEWTHHGVTMNSLVDFFAEPDPEWSI